MTNCLFVVNQYSLTHSVTHTLRIILTSYRYSACSKFGKRQITAVNLSYNIYISTVFKSSCLNTRYAECQHWKATCLYYLFTLVLFYGLFSILVMVIYDNFWFSLITEATQSLYRSSDVCRQWTKQMWNSWWEVWYLLSFKMTSCFRGSSYLGFQIDTKNNKLHRGLP